MARREPAPSLKRLRKGADESLGRQEQQGHADAELNPFAFQELHECFFSKGLDEFREYGKIHLCSFVVEYGGNKKALTFARQGFLLW